MDHVKSSKLNFWYFVPSSSPMTIINKQSLLIRLNKNSADTKILLEIKIQNEVL